MTSVPIRSTLTWDQFAAIVAEVVAEDEPLERSTSLMGDLGVDSLQLVELVVVLIDGCGMDRMADELPDRDWSTITIGELYDEYLTNGAI